MSEKKNPTTSGNSSKPVTANKQPNKKNSSGNGSVASSKTARSSTAAKAGSTAGRKRSSAASSSYAEEREEQYRNRDEMRQQNEPGNAFPYTREIVLLVVLAVCVIMFLSNFGACGSFGAVLETFCKGCLGKYLGYAFPIIIFLGIFYILYNWDEFFCWVRAAGGAVLLTGICGMMQGIGTNAENISTLLLTKDNVTSAGGILGKIPVKLLFSAIGKPGVIVIMLLLILIGFILLTGQSILELVRDLSGSAYSSAKREQQASRIRSEERRQQRIEEERLNARKERERERAVRNAGINYRNSSVNDSDGNDGTRRKSVMSASRITEPKNTENTEEIRKDAVTASAGNKKRAGEEIHNREDDAQEAGAGIPVITPRSSNPKVTIDGEESSFETKTFEAPVMARKRPVAGVTSNTKLRRDMPGDAQAKEMQITSQSQIQVVSKRNGNNEAKRMTYDSDFDLMAGDLFSDENMSKTSPDVVPPPVIRPQLKPRRDRRTLTELNQLDEGQKTIRQGANSRGNVSESSTPIVTMGEDGSYESLSDIYAKKKALPKDVSQASWDNPIAMTSDDTAGAPRNLPVAETEDVFDMEEVKRTMEHSTSDDKVSSTAANTGSKSVGNDVYDPATEADDGECSVTTSTGQVISYRKNSLPGEKPLSYEDTHDLGETARAQEEKKINIKKSKAIKNYKLPPLSLLNRGEGRTSSGELKEELQKTATLLEESLSIFGVKAEVVGVTCGPSVTLYEVKPDMGVRVSRITALENDLKLNLAAETIRIEAPIPGKNTVGIEIPNRKRVTVYLRELLESDEFKNEKSKVNFAVGKDISGKPICHDIAKMPHMLVSGTTGSGKSVFLNSIILSILYRAKPEEVQFIFVDPKQVEFSIYAGLPHLLAPVVSDAAKAAGALNWAVKEMEDRFNFFKQYQVRDIDGYNAKVDAMFEEGSEEPKPPHMSRIVIVVDEFADLMMMSSSKDVETAVIRLAQKARAAGIHLILATQTPRADIFTGLIKANIPSRVALKSSNQMESRIILDMGGAEQLMNHGDLLFFPIGYSKPLRLQGAYIADEERQGVVQFITDQMKDGVVSPVTKVEFAEVTSDSRSKGSEDSPMANDSGYDELFVQAGRFIIEKEKASIGMLQRMFRIGFNRAARIMDQLSEAGVVGPDEGTKPRQILMDSDQFDALIQELDL